jgi:hypothetical protein
LSNGGQLGCRPGTHTRLRSLVVVGACGGSGAIEIGSRASSAPS